MDDKRLVYNGQDVIRLIDRDTGKQVKQTLIANNQVVCAFPPDRRIDHHILVLGTARSGVAGDSECQTVRGYDLEKGRFVWSYTLKYPSEITLDSRDDSVTVATQVQDPRDYQISYGLSVLDLATGKPRWRTTSAKAYTDAGGKDLEDCSLRSGIAAAEPVVVSLAECQDYSSSDEPAPHVVGYDLETGKKLWTRSADWLQLSEDSGSFEEILPHPNDAAFFPATRGTSAGYVDLRTGQGRAVATPDVAQYEDSEDNSYEACDDFGENGNSFGDACVFPVADDTLLYVNSLSDPKTGTSLRMEGVAKQTGKRRFLVELKKPRPKPDEYSSGFTFLGIDDSREEFWLSTDDIDVSRYSVRTGKRTGRGQLAPPLGLTKIAAMGPGYLAVRGQGGISGPSRDVLSGMDYYRTNTTG